jgi:hypothetical protein
MKDYLINWASGIARSLACAVIFSSRHLQLAADAGRRPAGFNFALGYRDDRAKGMAPAEWDNW